MRTPPPPPQRGLRLLSIGDAGRGIVNAGLDWIQAHHGPIRCMIIDDTTTTSAALWAHHGVSEARCPVKIWAGSRAIRQERRPPVYGADRLWAVLREARSAADRVALWGPYAAFGPDNRRRRAWDVSEDRVFRAAVTLGWRGWVMSDLGLRAMSRPPAPMDLGAFR